MKIIYAINTDEHVMARVHIGCADYQDMFIDFLLAIGASVAIMEEEDLPSRTAEEQEVVDNLMVGFKEYLDSRVLH